MRSWSKTRNRGLLASLVMMLLSGIATMGAADEGIPQEPEDEPWDLINDLGYSTGGLQLQYGGRFVFDLIKYGDDNKRRNGFEFDTARLVAMGQYESFYFRVEPDLIGVDSARNLRDAWMTWEYLPGHFMTAGQFFVASGTEGATREDALPLAGYGFTTYLNGRYDLGINLYGDLLPKELWYSLTGAAGKGFDLEGIRRESELYSLRLVHHPLIRIDPAGYWLKGFFWGAGVAFTPNFDDPIVLVTPLESTVFITPDLDGQGSRWFHLEAGYAVGPFRFGGERIEGRIDGVLVGNGHRTDFEQLSAWTTYASWNLTGYEPEWEQGRWLSIGEAEMGKDPSSRGRYGCWEMAVRYSNADMDRKLFNYGLTDYNPSTQEVRTFSLHLNYYPVKKAQISLGWVKTLADHELSTFGGTSRDSSFVLRLALNF
ncbi:MAG: porin [Planctomycetota bacterium]